MTRRVGEIKQSTHKTVPGAKKPLLHILFTLCLRSLRLSVPLCLILSTLQPARAYVLPGPHLLLLMIQNLGTASGLVVHQRILVLDEDGSQVEFPETLTYRFPDAFRSEIDAPDFGRIHVDTAEAAIIIVDDKVSVQDDNLFDRYKDLLLFRSRMLIQERLEQNGIDPMVSSIGRLDGVPVYILGARYPDETLPQVWLEKETFRPLRLLIPEGDTRDDAALLEFRYLRWRKNKKMWYPMQIQCFRNNHLVRELIVDEMVMNPLITDDVFDIGQLRIQYGAGMITERDMSPAEAPSDIQKALDDFKKRYE